MTDTTKAAFVERLQTAIKAAGGRHELNRRAGVKDRTLYTYLAGREPKFHVVAAIADASGVSIEWLATGRGPMRPKSPRLPVSSLLSGTDLAARLDRAVQLGGGIDAVCERGDLNPSLLAFYLDGEPLHPTTVVHLARACLVNLEWLLAGIEPIVPEPVGVWDRQENERLRAKLGRIRDLANHPAAFGPAGRPRAGAAFADVAAPEAGA